LPLSRHLLFPVFYAALLSSISRLDTNKYTVYINYINNQSGQRQCWILIEKYLFDERRGWIC
jgi:hypothetical protein